MDRHSGASVGEICEALGGTAFNTTYAVFSASLTARAVVPIARNPKFLHGTE